MDDKDTCENCGLPCLSESVDCPKWRTTEVRKDEENNEG